MNTYNVTFHNNSKNRHWDYTGVTHIIQNRTSVTIKGIDPATMEPYKCFVNKEEFDSYEVCKED